MRGYGQYPAALTAPLLAFPLLNFPKKGVIIGGMKEINGAGAGAPRRMTAFLGIFIALTAALYFAFSGDELFATERKHRITIGGTGCALGGVKLVAGAFQKENPDIVITIVPSLGSVGGIKAVLAGAIDVALTARPLNDVEQAQGAWALAYARTPLVFAASGRAKPIFLSLRQVVSIYAGETRQWPDGTPLRLILRPATDTDMASLKRMSPEMGKAVDRALSRNGLLSAVTDQDNADVLSKLSGAFGAVTLAQILSEDRPLKPVILDGVAPSPANLASGAYPFAKTFYAVLGPRSSVPAKRFRDYLVSPAGRAILARYGHLAPAGEPR